MKTKKEKEKENPLNKSASSVGLIIISDIDIIHRLSHLLGTRHMSHAIMIRT